MLTNHFLSNGPDQGQTVAPCLAWLHIFGSSGRGGMKARLGAPDGSDALPPRSRNARMQRPTVGRPVEKRVATTSTQPCRADRNRFAAPDLNGVPVLRLPNTIARQEENLSAPQPIRYLSRNNRDWQGCGHGALGLPPKTGTRSRYPV